MCIFALLARDQESELKEALLRNAGGATLIEDCRTYSQIQWRRLPPVLVLIVFPRVFNNSEVGLVDEQG